MKSNHSFIRILLFVTLILVLLCCCFAQNKGRIKKVRRFEESEIYDDIIRAEDDEFVDDIPVDENDLKDDDQDVDYENCIEYQGGHKETYTPHRGGDKSSSQAAAAAGSSDSRSDSSDSKDSASSSAQQQLSFNPYTYYKSLLDNDLNYLKYYGDKVNTHGTDSQYSQIAKKYANNLANHAKYLYKYRTFAPSTYRKYILQVYEYSKRVVEVAKVQNWNGYMYYLSITVEYYRKIDVLEQTGYAGTNYVQTTPVATYYGASGTPTAYYSNGAPPAGAVTATAVAPVNPSYYPSNYGYGAAPANYYNGYGGYPANNAGYGTYGYGGYPANYGYANYPASYYPAQYRQPVQQYVAKGANVNNQQPAQASSSSQASSNATSASSSSSSSSSPSSNSNSTGGASSANNNPSPPQKKKLNPIEQLEILNSQVSPHVGEFNDDASNPTTEPFSFEYLM